MAVPGTRDIQAVIFDCFGVLYIDKKQRLFGSLPPSVAVEFRDIFQQANYGLLSREEYIKAATNLTGQTAEEFIEASSEGYDLNEELVTTIRNIKSKVKVGLLSNIGRGWINDFFNTHELNDLFDAVVLSGEEGVVKPEQRIYEIAAERLGVAAEQCLMIDDIESNCAGADAAGMAAIHFVSNRQCLTELESYISIR